jgi:hypothetical protein
VDTLTGDAGRVDHDSRGQREVAVWIAAAENWVLDTAYSHLARRRITPNRTNRRDRLRTARVTRKAPASNGEAYLQRRTVLQREPGIPPPGTLLRLHYRLALPKLLPQ